MFLHVKHVSCAYSWYTVKEMDKIITDRFQALLANKNRDISSPLYFSCKSVVFGCCIVLFKGTEHYVGRGRSGKGDDGPSKPSFRLVVGPNAAVLLSSVGSVHAGSTFPAIQGASLTTLSSQPNSLVTGSFPAEDEQHSQPVSPQGLHYLHSAYRVGKDGQVGFYGPLERGIQGRTAGFHCHLAVCYCTCWG